MTTFASPGDVRQRLDKTVCRYRGDPVYVTADGGSYTIVLSPVGESRSSKRFILDLAGGVPGDFDFSVPPLGYLDGGEEAFYVKVSPRRQYAGGANLNNLVVTNSRQETAQFPSPLFMTKAFARCVIGEHMPLARAIELVSSGEKRSAAFARHFAVRSSEGVMFLEYRTVRVGAVDRSGRVSLFDTDYASVVLHELKKLGITP